jgi:hypothetical protein
MFSPRSKKDAECFTQGTAFRTNALNYNDIRYAFMDLDYIRYAFFIRLI